MASKPTIQRGSKALGTSASVDIVRGTDAGFDSTVDITKTILQVKVRSTSSTQEDLPCNWELVDGNTIRVTRLGTGSGTTVEWELWSFATGMTVQHETVTLTSSTGTAVIDAGGLGGRFIIGNGAVMASGLWLSVYAGVRWKFNSTTEIEASITTYSVDVVAKCQVVEWDTATVQTIEWPGDSITTLTTDKTITAVDTAKTIVFVTGRATAGDMRETSFVPSLFDTTTLRLTRGAASTRTLTATAYVVEVPSGVFTQRIVLSHTGTTTETGTLNTAIVVADTGLILSSTISGYSLGYGDMTTVIRASATAVLNDTTTVQTQRGSTVSSPLFIVQVVEFLNTAPFGHPAAFNDGGHPIIMSPSDGRPMLLSR